MPMSGEAALAMNAITWAGFGSVIVGWVLSMFFSARMIRHLRACDEPAWVELGSPPPDIMMRSSLFNLSRQFSVARFAARRHLDPSVQGAARWVVGGEVVFWSGVALLVYDIVARAL